MRSTSEGGLLGNICKITWQNKLNKKGWWKKCLIVRSQKRKKSRKKKNKKRKNCKNKNMKNTKKTISCRMTLVKSNCKSQISNSSNNWVRNSNHKIKFFKLINRKQMFKKNNSYSSYNNYNSLKLKARQSGSCNKKSQFKKKVLWLP